MPEQHVSDRLLKEMWRSVQGPHADLTGPLIRFAGLVASEYRQIALSHDAALEQADLQIKALRAEQARLRAGISDLHREVVCDLMTTFNQAERKGLARAGRRIEALMTETPAEDDGKSARDHRPAFSQVDLDTATKPLHAEIERLSAENERLKALVIR